MTRQSETFKQRAGIMVLAALTVFNFLPVVSVSQAQVNPGALFEVWDEEIKANCGIVVALDGSVLLFTEEREPRGSVEVKRSEDGGTTWGARIEVGKLVKLDDDMSDDGRYKEKNELGRNRFLQSDFALSQPW